MAKIDSFEQYRQDIIFAAGAIYAAEHAGQEPDLDETKINIVPTVVDGTESARRDAERREGEVNVAARALARISFLQDIRDQGGFKGALARVEIGLTSIIDRRYIGAAMRKGLPDVVRGKKPLE